jgi:hypothetical protein
MTTSAGNESQRAPEPPVTFQVGGHTLELTCTPRWQWLVSIDSRQLPNYYASQADAWTAGVREAFGLH